MSEVERMWRAFTSDRQMDEHKEICTRLMECKEAMPSDTDICHEYVMFVMSKGKVVPHMPEVTL